MPTLGIDFDGVIHRYSRGWGDGTAYDDPMPGAIEGLKLLMDHYAVFIFTSRNSDQVLKWMADNTDISCVTDEQVPTRTFYDLKGTILITNRKLPAVAYLDDRAVKFTSWDTALLDLMKYAQGKGK